MNSGQAREGLAQLERVFESEGGAAIGSLKK